MGRAAVRSSCWCFFFLISSRVLPAPPGETRVEHLGGEGIELRAAGEHRFSDEATGVGDVNGDGFGDFLAALWEPGVDDSFRPVLVFGRKDLPRAIHGLEVESFSRTLRTGVPQVNGSDLLYGGGPAGDIDRDGFADFFVFRQQGARPDWPLPTIVPGVLYLVYGSSQLPDEVLLEAPPVGLRVVPFTSSRTANTAVGFSAAAGDLSGDGKPDIAIGAPGADPDGAAPEWSGRVYVLLGQGPWTEDVDVEEASFGCCGTVIEGTRGEEQLGRTLAFAGDVNGDGLGDVALGTALGDVFVLFGAASYPPSLTTTEMVASGRGVRLKATYSSGREAAIAPMGDLDGDGIADLAVGSAGANNHDGAVYVVRGRRDLSGEVNLLSIHSTGQGAAFLGEDFATPLPGTESFGGETLAALDHDGDGIRDLIVGSPGFSGFEGTRLGKAYLIPGASIEWGAKRSLEDIEKGAIPGSVFTTESRLWLGDHVSSAGDVNGDGKDDILLGAPGLVAIDDSYQPRAYLIYGPARALRLDEVRPAEAPVEGGQEVTLIGTGFDETVQVRIGSREAKVLRVETTARLVVEAPQVGALGPVDITVTRGAESSALVAGVRYVHRVYPDIVIDGSAPGDRGVLVRGTDLHHFSASTRVLDFDGDGFADATASAGVAAVFMLYGAATPPAEVQVDGKPSTADPAVSILSTGAEYSEPKPIGDVNGDGAADLAIWSDGTIWLLFGGARWEHEQPIGRLLDQGRGVAIHTPGRSLSAHPRVAGGGDLDGDGFNDLAVSFADRIPPRPSTVWVVRGRTTWPRDIEIEDTATIVSDAPGDSLGLGLALLPDVTGDGRGDLVLGAPSGSGSTPGETYLLSLEGVDLSAGSQSRVEDLLALGEGFTIAGPTGKDGFGYGAASPGDWNGDGWPDLAVAAESGGGESRGEIYVISGGPALVERARRGPFSAVDLASEGLATRILGEWIYDYANDVLPAGDWNGDGLSDLAVNVAISIQRFGKAYLVLGGAPGDMRLASPSGSILRIQGAEQPPRMTRVAGVGDVNGDGVGDIVLSSGPYGNYAGDPLVHVLFGDAADGRFIRGDANLSGTVDLSDAVFTLNFLFLGHEGPPCEDAADGNDDGKLDLSDAVYVLGHLFLGGPAPALPFPERGIDPTPDGLGCSG